MKSIEKCDISSFPLRKNACLFLFLAIIAFKFWLIASTDIGDVSGDSVEYVKAVLHFEQFPAPFGPGTALFAIGWKSFGVPLRLGYEIGFIAGLMIFVSSIIQKPWQCAWGLIAFSFALFNPLANWLFSWILSDPVSLIVSLLALGFFAKALQEESRKRSLLSSIASGGFFAFSVITRTQLELVLALLSLALLSTIVVALTTKACEKNSRQMKIWRPLMVLVVILITLSVHSYVDQYHAKKWGYNGLSYIDSKEYRSLYSALKAVGESDGQLYFPIGKERRDLISRCGHACALLMTKIESAASCKQVSKDAYGTYDIATGWFHWAVFRVPPTKDDFILIAAARNEIEKARLGGVIHVRHENPLPDDRMKIVVPAFWMSAKKMLNFITSGPDSYTYSNLPFVDPDVDAATTRRHLTADTTRLKVILRICRMYSYLFGPRTCLVCVFLLLVTAALQIWRGIFEKTVVAPIGPWIAWVFGAMLLFYYAWIDVSGLPAGARYVVYSNVIVPIVIVWSLREISLSVRARIH